jgi:hypothetical protein
MSVEWELGKDWKETGSFDLSSCLPIVLNIFCNWLKGYPRSLHGRSETSWL